MSLSTVFNMGKPFIPIHDTPYTEKKVYTTEPIEKRLERALSESGFSDIGITIEPDGVRIEAQNNKYYYAPRALSVVLRLVRLITPPRLRNIEIILTQNGIPMTQYTALRDDLDELYREKLTRDEFSYLSKLRTDVYRKPDVDITHRKWVDFGLKPRIRNRREPAFPVLRVPGGRFRLDEYPPLAGRVPDRRRGLLSS